MAERWLPRKVIGLDINPRAIKVAWVNLYLNALSDDGLSVLDHEGKSLLDRVEFHVSDLLAYCREQNLTMDLIVGCIPQILNPDPTAMSKLVSENASEEFLYSLSNYCGLQGFVEDQFGLGLVARATEEGISIIRPTGKLIFNIGGRPGQAVTERLFSRRGFHIKKLWQTRVNQAADTDILALVEIEKNTRHRFEFFMGRVSEEPISARTAWAFLKSGGEISHGLSVYECRLRMPNQVKTISKFLNNGFHDTRGALDLSFKDEAVAEEKIPFLAHLARGLEDLSYFPHESPAGSCRFRNLIAGFMRIYHHIPLTPASVVILPSRAVAIENILRLYSPRLALVDAALTRWLPKKWITALPAQAHIGTNSIGSSKSNNSVTVVEAPRRSDLVVQLLKNLKPQIVVTSLADYEMRTSTAFELLLNATASIGARLILDMSEYLELSSLPGTNGVLQYLSSHPMPLHATVICGLLKNQVYSDLEVAFVMSENRTLLNALAKAGDVTYGRTAISSQFYYGCLFHELLSFQLPERHTNEQRLPREEEASEYISISRSTAEALSGVENVNLDQRPPTICMDFDENLLQVPAAVKVSVFEGFARQNISDDEIDPRPEILEYLESTFGVPHSYTKEIFLSDTSTSLFTKLVLACVEENGTLVFPMGSCGTLVSVAKFLEADFRILPTKVSDSFKATAGQIDSFLTGIKKPWMYIPGPTINPTGQLYTNSEISEILSICKKYGARVILNTSFSGLEYSENGSWKWDLKQIGTESENSTYAVAILGGLSTGLMTGGIEFGFSAVADAVFIEAFKDAPTLSRPHGTLKYSIKKLLGLLVSQKFDDLVAGLEVQKKILQHRAEQLCKLLKECGWDVVEPLGGTSMVATPSAFYGKCVKGESTEALCSENIRDALLKFTDLSISSSSWTGIPNYCRFMLGLTDEVFAASCRALLRFKELVL
ncbi:methionine S-methyltransferase isoform X2 [Physcomitrium patens]|nr:methionine S-methyltransferase-like isoform X2 [Physcomitrium patens]|eukprot:XP_024361870.1 methionine S-methyltransferase-like isoform X2 [Physcomitrella patens]